jgi:hypothetical protein
LKLKNNVSIALARPDGSVIRDDVVEQPIKIVEGSTEGIKDFNREQFAPVGRCIYCGASGDKLNREHIVPLGLNGVTVLPEASCRRCTGITGDFEGRVLAGPLRDARIHLKFRSRTKYANAAVDLPVRVVRAGAPASLFVPRDRYPVMLHFPLFPPPRILTGASGTGIDVSGVASILFGGKSPADLAKELGVDSISLDTKHCPAEFARMLAKIAYAMAVAVDAVRDLAEPCPVLPAILGDEEDIGRWVGTHTEPIRKYASLEHRVHIYRSGQGLLMGEVQLFAHSETPSYGIVLGRLATG